MDSQKGVLLVLLDLSAAFDTVDHSKLLTRLNQRIGLRDTALHWFKSYLENRQQSVSISNSTSSPTTMRYGVPQGSVLGPLLFTIYTLPIGDITRELDIWIHLYADDSQLYITFEIKGNPATAVKRMECCIDRIRAWMEGNNLKLNDDKTDAIVIASPHLSSRVAIPSVRVGTSEIPPSPVVTDLGVTFDSNMTMLEHIKKICAIAYFHLRNIASIRKCLTDEATVQLVHAFVTSRLDSCNALLYGLPDCAIQRLQRVQNMAARMVTRKSKFDSITPLLVSLHWLPVKQRIVYKLMLLTHKVLHGMAPMYLRELIQEYNPTRSLRSEQTGLLVIPRCRLRVGERSFACAAPKLWNALPQQLRQVDSLDAFKSSLKTYLFKKAFGD